jgi:hypothetical protein
MRKEVWDWGMESLECNYISKAVAVPEWHADESCAKKAFLSDGTKPEPERLLDIDSYVRHDGVCIHFSF